MSVATANILSKLKKDLQDVLTRTGKSLGYYTLEKGNVIGTGIDTLEKLLTYSQTKAHKKEITTLLSKYRNAEKSLTSSEYRKEQLAKLIPAYLKES